MHSEGLIGLTISEDISLLEHEQTQCLIIRFILWRLVNRGGDLIERDACHLVGNVFRRIGFDFNYKLISLCDVRAIHFHGVVGARRA